MLEADYKETIRRNGDVKVMGSAEEDPLEEVMKLKGELKKALSYIRNSLATDSGKDSKDEKKHSLKNVWMWREGACKEKVT